LKKEFEEMCDRVREARATLGLTQREIAAKLGVSPSRISEIEKYRQAPSKETVKRLADIYNIDAHWIFTGEGKMLYDQRALVDKKRLEKAIQAALMLTSKYKLDITEKDIAELVHALYNIDSTAEDEASANEQVVLNFVKRMVS